MNEGHRDGPTDDADRIARNAGFSLAVQLLSAVFTAFLTLFLVRALDPAGYGIFGLAAAIGSLMLLPSDFGLSQAAARFVAENRSDRSVIVRIVSDALRIKVAITGSLCLGLLLGAGPIASAYGKPGLAWVLRGFAIALLGQSVMLFLSYVFTAQGKTFLNLRLVLIESAVETSSSIGLVLLGAGATGAAFGRAIGYVVGAIAALALMTRSLGRPLVVKKAGGWTRPLLRYGGALLIVDSAYTLFGAIDTLVIGAFLSAAHVGLFSAPMRLIGFLQMPAVALTTGVSPRMAEGRRGKDELNAFVAALRYVTVFQAALVPPLLVWSHPIVKVVLGSNYGGSANVLKVLVPFVFLLGFGDLLSVVANYLGQARRRIPIAIFTVTTNVIIDVILIPRIGIVGGAIGTDVAYAFYAPAHFWICKSILDFPVRPFVRTLVGATGAAVAMAGTLLAFGTHDVSAPGLVTGYATSLAVFATVLFATGALSVVEVRMLLTMSLPGRRRR